MRCYLRLMSVSVLFALILAGCQKTVTYAEQKAREREQINDFIQENNIDVITLDEFLKDTITNNPETGPDKTRNEFVLFPDNGVYMQIIRRGTGTTLAADARKTYTCRYMEFDIANNDTLSLNYYNTDPDEMTCTRVSDTYSATFTSGQMYILYGSSVPSGWLVPMPFIKPAFYNGTPSAKLRLIVPHDQGNKNAMQSVFPCYYELTIKTEKWQ